MPEPNLSTLAVSSPPPPPPTLWKVAGAIAAAATMGGIYLALSNRSPTSKLGVPVSSNYLPTNTLAVVNLSTDPQRWQQLRQLGTPQSRTVLTQELAKWQQEFFAGLDWERDVRPGLGSELSIAYLVNQNKNLPILLIPMGSEQQATQLLTKIMAAPGTTRTTGQQYQGLKLSTSNSKNQGLVAVVLDRWLLLSTSPPAIQQSIDAFKSGKNLATAPGYSPAWGAIGTAQPLAQVYVNIPLLVAGNARSIAPDKLAQMQQQGVAANINLDGQVLLAKGISWWPAQSKAGLVPSKNSPNLAGRLPDNTVMMMAGHDLAQLWADYLPLASKNPAAPIPPEMVTKTLQSATGINLATDILAWSKNEFGVALVPANKPGQSSLGGSLLLILQSNDRSATEQMFSKLDRTMADRYQFQVAKARTNNTDVINWSSALGGVNGTHGWLSDNLAFLALGTPITDRFLPQPPASLANNSQFQQVMRSEIAPHSGQFFINLEKMPLINTVLPQLHPQAQEVASGINAIGLTSNASSEITNRFDLSILLRQVAGEVAPRPMPTASSPRPASSRPSRP
jgi:Protein of unknown function (DUF3352)